MSGFKNLSDDTKKKIIIVGGILLIIFIFVFSYFNRQSDNYSSIKVYKNNYLVYTSKKDNNGVYKKNVPYLNIKSQTAKSINKDIETFVSSYFEKEKAVISYEYDINGYVLSLIIKIIDYDTDYAPEAYFRSYNFNLNTLNIIDNNSLFKIFNTNESEVETVIENKFEEYYEELLDLEYFDERECNYECFLQYREVDDYLDSVVYYVKNSSLVAYKPFVFYSIYGEEEYFTEEHFKFVIKES